ncbi:hypothetical protein BKA93DRAFT_350307 [Sparassis latifolia]
MFLHCIAGPLYSSIVAPFQNRPATTVVGSPKMPTSQFSYGLTLLASLAEHHEGGTHNIVAADLDEPPAPESPRKKTCSLSDSSNASSSGRRPTSGEKRREKKLREDRMAIVLSPQMVQCQRCGAKIKLSLKSTYDPFHWQKHRERCLKRPDGVARSMKAATEQHKPAWPAESKIRTASNGRAPSSLTPPLTSDGLEDDERSSEDSAVKREFASPPTLPEPELALHKPDAAFEDYLVRSHRRAMRELSPLTVDSCHSWTWAQLKEPIWIDQSGALLALDDDADDRLFPAYRDIKPDP